MNRLGKIKSILYYSIFEIIKKENENKVNFSVSLVIINIQIRVNEGCLVLWF